MNLNQAIVVITGGSRGLGRALAERFIGAGAIVFISSKDKAELEKIAVEIGAQAIAFDVRNETEVIKAGQTVVGSHGKIDIWINNAGVWLPHAPIEKMDMNRVHDMVEVNLFGTIYGSKFALQQMRRQGSGVIVNILSTSALTGRAYSSGYCASKYAAVGFTNTLRLEAEPDHIKVISVYPGGMKTNLFDEAKPENYGEFMKTEDVAEKIVGNLEQDNPDDEQIIKRPS